MRWLNEHIIVDSKLEGAQIIDLPINYLKKNNVVEIKASNPGVLFFITNHYTLKDIGIKDKRKLLRNIVDPELGLHILNEALNKTEIIGNQLNFV